MLAGEWVSKRASYRTSAVLDTGFEGGMLLPAEWAALLGPLGGALESDRLVTVTGEPVTGARGLLHVALPPPRKGDKPRRRVVDAFFADGVTEPLLGARWLALAGGYAVVDQMRWNPGATLTEGVRPNPAPGSPEDWRRRLAELPPLRIGMGLTREDPSALKRLHERPADLRSPRGKR